MSHQKAIGRSLVPSVPANFAIKDTKKPALKVLLLDIETAPNQVYTWGVWQQNVGSNQFIKPSRMISWAAKWNHQKTIKFRSEFHDGRDKMITEMWKLMDEADLIVHYNGKKFDVPAIQHEFLRLRLTPPSPFKQLDVLKTVRSQFKFQHNKLDFVCQELGIGKKVDHPGMELWVKCLEGDEKAWRLMKKYNKQDVKLLEELYELLMPWHKIVGCNWSVYVDGTVCKNCGSGKMVKRGLERTGASTYQRWLCEACGTWQRGSKSLHNNPNGMR